jgi:uncharacterized protein DUF6328
MGDNAERNETEAERRDRQIGELLQELRVAQTGTQVLFAFLLTVPFSQRFTVLDSDQRVLYFVTMLVSALAVVFLIAPIAWHRWLFERHDKAYLVEISHRLALAGLALVGLAVAGVVVLIATVMYPGGGAIAAGVLVIVPILVVWVIMPVRRRRA